MATKGPTPKTLAHSQPCVHGPPKPTPHLGRWALQGVAVQQNDLQVPEAAEGDRDAGDTVTGEIQADKRKVPQLWGWVREESGACPRMAASCSLPLPSALTSSATWGPTRPLLWLARGCPETTSLHKSGPPSVSLSTLGPAQPTCFPPFPVSYPLHTSAHPHSQVAITDPNKTVTSHCSKTFHTCGWDCRG